jgi:hypothetical protein
MTEILANPFTFWHIFEIAVVVILAIALARLVIGLAFSAIVFVVGLIVSLFSYLVLAGVGTRRSRYRR